ncbi:MAG: Flp family type IVb pilin [Rhodoferax sp.]|nr:Flp family type IVb pilin [Rhodoferax sp.]
MKNIFRDVCKFWRDEQGATAVEYGVMVALIAVVVIAVVAEIGVPLNDFFVRLKDCLTTPSGCV